MCYQKAATMAMNLWDKLPEILQSDIIEMIPMEKSYLYYRLNYKIYTINPKGWYYKYIKKSENEGTIAQIECSKAYLIDGTMY